MSTQHPVTVMKVKHVWLMEEKREKDVLKSAPMVYGVQSVPPISDAQLLMLHASNLATMILMVSWLYLFIAFDI